MKRKEPVKSSETQRKLRPALSPEANENQVISLAFDLVKKRMIEGTASSQETTYFLKLGSTRAKTEKEILELQKQLIEAKTESIKSARRMEEIYTNALDAMKKYSGSGDSDDE